MSSLECILKLFSSHTLKILMYIIEVVLAGNITRARATLPGPGDVHVQVHTRSCVYLELMHIHCMIIASHQRIKLYLVKGFQSKEFLVALNPDLLVSQNAHTLNNSYLYL